MSLRSQLIRDEGTRLVVYQDTRGNCTLGVGHKGSTPLSIRAVNQILDDDIESHTADLLTAMPWAHALSPNRFNVLVNMCVNMGIGGLLRFKTMIAELQTVLDENGTDYSKVAEAMRHSKWHDEVPERAERLAKQMECDIEQ